MAGATVDYEIDPSEVEAVRSLAISKGFTPDQAEYKVREYARARGSSVKGRLFSAAEGELNKRVRLQAENIDPSYALDPKKKAEVDAQFKPGSPEGKAFARYMRGKMDGTVRPQDTEANDNEGIADLLRPPAKLLDTAASSVSLGGYAEAANAAGIRPQQQREMTPSIPPARNSRVNDNGPAEDIDWQAQDVPESGIPGAEIATDIAASMIGAPGVIAGKAGKAFDAATKTWKASGRIAAAGKGLLKGLATYEATAPATAAIRTSEEGGSGSDAADAAGATAINPVGVGFSAAGGLAGGLAERYATRTRSTARLPGRIIRDVKAGGGEINAFGDEPVSGGVYDNPVMNQTSDGQPMPEGREAVNRMGAHAGRDFTRYNRARVRLARTQHGQALQIVEDAHPFQMTTEPLEDAMAAAREKILINKKVPDSVGKLDEAIENVRGLLRRDTQETRMAPERIGDMGVKTAETVKRSTPEISMKDLLRVKREVQDSAEFGLPATPENRPYRLLYDTIATFTEDADSTGTLKVANKRFKTVADDVRRANDVIHNQDALDIAPGGSVDPQSSTSPQYARAAAERRAGVAFGRIGDDTQAGTAAAEQMEQLARSNPRYARLMTFVRAAKARESLRYGNSGANQTNLDAGLSRGAPGYAGMAGLTPGNLGIAGIRVALPVAEKAVIPGAPKVAAGASVGASLLSARDKKRERERKQREALGRE